MKLETKWFHFEASVGAVNGAFAVLLIALKHWL
jgi:hypothetical protein